MRQLLVPDSGRAPIEFSLAHRLTDSFRLGVEYMPRDDRWNPVWNWRFLEASGWRPALLLGQSSAWPSSKASGSAFSFTVAQSLGRGVSAYVAASYAPDGDLWQMPAGLNWQVTEEWSTRLMYDGANFHPILTRHQKDWSMSLMLLGGTDPTVAYSYSF